MVDAHCIMISCCVSWCGYEREVSLTWELAMGRVERRPWVSLKTGRQLSQTLGEDRRGPDIFPKGFSSIQVYSFFLWNSVLTSWRPRSEPALCGGVK